MGSVDASESPFSSQQGLNSNASTSHHLHGPNNWHHPRLLRDLARIITSLRDRMERIDQSIPEAGIPSVVRVPTQALSEAYTGPALHKLEEM